MSGQVRCVVELRRAREAARFLLISLWIALLQRVILRAHIRPQLHEIGSFSCHSVFYSAEMALTWRSVRILVMYQVDVAISPNTVITTNCLSV
ncbi:hypothetical protein H4582DRAFT_1522270 [Lactarius indigo]|nr:hypothetical protein H4582DRAFT_1522270 [Lactarius indigo]